MTHSGEDALVGGGGEEGFACLREGLIGVVNVCGEVFVVDGYRVSEGLMRVGKGVQLVGVGGKGVV